MQILDRRSRIQLKVAQDRERRLHAPMYPRITMPANRTLIDVTTMQAQTIKRSNFMFGCLKAIATIETYLFLKLAVTERLYSYYRVFRCNHQSPNKYDSCSISLFKLFQFRHALGGGGVYSVHGRSRMAIDSRIPTMPGRRTSGFHQPGRHCLHQARSAVRCSVSSIKGGWTASFQEPLVRRTSAPCAYFLTYG